MIIEKSITGRKLQCVVRQMGKFQINYMTCKMGIEIFTLYACCHIGFVIALNTNCNFFFKQRLFGKYKSIQRRKLVTQLHHSGKMKHFKMTLTEQEFYFLKKMYFNKKMVGGKAKILLCTIL